MNETIRNEKKLLTVRIYNAPKELVFDAWTDPVHLANWFGPNGFTITTEKFNLEVGGEWKFMMHGPDGTDFPNLIRFTTIKRPDLLEYVQFGDESTEDDSFNVSISFSETEGKTKLVMEMTFRSKEYLDFVINEYGALEGQKQTLTRLEEYLESLKSES